VSVGGLSPGFRGFNIYIGNTSKCFSESNMEPVPITEYPMTNVCSASPQNRPLAAHNHGG